ncbi:HPr(Ser) kinase/phosphatase [Numidum massiliense]|uniref:HPr(Ser) kinase/phosphatase n=1 Tax=Numidum massiliense TaxID=1522315 RepID=UPI0006D5816A|nr:HPr(Ser) kinase/phosphatase [Numidum massiliense]
MVDCVTVEDLVRRFDLQVLCGSVGLDHKLCISDLSRPGLEMAGYFTYYPAERIQLLGRTELTFFQSLSAETRTDRMQKLCRPETPCICITRNYEAPPELLEAAEAIDLPVLRTDMPTTKFASKLTNYLEVVLAPRETLHGVLVDVYGIGILLVGSSGIGKSETALELVKRGHRLVADDAVEIRQATENRLVGAAPELIRHLLEIRGLGIINVMTLFGAGAVRNHKAISLVMRLEVWQENRMYERLGLDEERMKIIDTELPLLTVPVRPGRNLAVIIEVAAMNYRLKRLGDNAAVDFAQRLKSAIEADDEVE